MFNIVQVETTNKCNAHCIFCVHDKFKKFHTMGEDLYRKIVEDCAQYDLIQFIPMLTGEPFMDPDIIKRIKYARTLLNPETEIRIYSNGSLVTKEQIDELAEVPNFQMSISLNGSNAAIRKEMMGLDDFEDVVWKARYIYSKGILAYTSTVWFPTMSMEDINALSRYPRPTVLTMQNWANEIYNYRRQHPTCCNRVTDTMTILVSGDMNLCCFDPFGKTNFGNMEDCTLKESWENSRRQKYIDYHIRNEGQKLPMCRNCTQGG